MRVLEGRNLGLSRICGLTALSRREGSQWLTAGVITKQFADGVKEHRFIRAETHSTKDEADAFSITKAKQIIDEVGDRLFQKG